MLDIDKLRYTYEKPFLDLMDGMERKVHPDYPHRTIWYKEDGWYFEQDEKNGDLWCQYDRVWSFFETNYSSNYAETQSIIRNLMERHYKLRGLTPDWLRKRRKDADGKTLQFEGVNTLRVLPNVNVTDGKTLQFEGVNTTMGSFLNFHLIDGKDTTN